MKTGLLLFEIMSPLSSAPHHSHDYLCSSLTNSKSKHSDNKSSILNLIQHVNGHIQHLSTWLQCSGSYSKKNQVHRLHAEQRWSWTEMATSVFLTCSSLHSCDTMHLFEELLREPERKHCFFLNEIKYMHTQYCKALIREASRKMLKGIVEHFAK